MLRLLTAIRRNLNVKILLALSGCVAMVMGGVIVLAMASQQRHLLEQMTSFGHKLQSVAYAAIEHPMALGDSATVDRQLFAMREQLDGSEVIICDFNEMVVFASHSEQIGKPLSTLTANWDFLSHLREMLADGSEISVAGHFEEVRDGRRYLLTIDAIDNRPECYHCHGTSRRVLGGLITRHSTDSTYGAIAALRTHTIAISLLGIAALVLLAYLLLVRLVTRPVEELAEKAGRIAAGDLDVAVTARSEDAIGMLGRSFNSMARSVKDSYSQLSSFSKELEREVDRRTTMLREKTFLLERANRELRELDKLKSSFLANMSHELRTPMNSIIGYTDLLIDRVDGEINLEQEKSLGKVQHNARHLLQLINDILDMAKIESGKVTLDPASVDIRALTESMATIFEPTIARKGLAFNLDLGVDLPAVYVDEDKVRQIFINLLSNAVKFTSQGAITISVSPLAPNGGGLSRYVKICVDDTGIGIRPGDLGTLFDKFSQIDSSTVRRYEGTGLGLSIARGLVVLHKGKIWATSILGKGSTFCFTLPTSMELFEKPIPAKVEPQIAELLAQFFERPAETFLKPPRHGGRPIKCWEFAHCGQASCPAHGNEEHRCWLIPGTHCRGTKVAECSEKIDFCKSCEIIDLLLLAENEPPVPCAPARDKQPPVVVPPHRKTVLVIDDNAEVVDLVGKYIGEEYQVVGLLGGEAAVTKAMELQPAVITLDIMMPGKDGWQVLHELKQNPATQDIPVVVLSIVDNKKLGFSLGAAEYIVKPVDKNLLLRKLRSLEKIARIRRILVVDNEKRTVAMLSELLEENGYQVAGAVNSGAAAEALEAAPADLIVLNPIMPAADGFDFIERLKSNPRTKDIPLILLTQQSLSEGDLENLNGHIRAILNRTTLTEEGLREELVETIRRCGG
jgi:signal transduction histidine kinase/CheY-like chemotaxis protein